MEDTGEALERYLRRRLGQVHEKVSTAQGCFLYCSTGQALIFMSQVQDDYLELKIEGKKMEKHFDFPKTPFVFNAFRQYDYKLPVSFLFNGQEKPRAIVCCPLEDGQTRGGIVLANYENDYAFSLWDLHFLRDL